MGALVSVGATRGDGVWSRILPATPRTFEPVRFRTGSFFGGIEEITTNSTA